MDTPRGGSTVAAPPRPAPRPSAVPEPTPRPAIQWPRPSRAAVPEFASADVEPRPLDATPVEAAGWKQAAFRWLNRPRRVLFTLSAIWIIAGFDLLFTMSEWGKPGFVELNPVAARVLTGATQHIYAFKFGTLALGTAILIGVRQHRVAELGCWLLLALMVVLALRWNLYDESILRGDANVILGPPD